MMNKLKSFCGVGLVFIAGCAIGELKDVGGEKDLPAGVPGEFGEKFKLEQPVELNDAVTQPAAATAATAPEQSKPTDPAPGKVDKKKQKKGAAADPKVTSLAPKKVFPKGFPGYPSRRPQLERMWIGEKQVFELTYFGVPAGLINLEILPFAQINDRKVYRILGTAKSSKLFSAVYEVNDSIESFIDYEGLFSHRFHIKLDETKQKRDSLELYDSEKAKTFFWNRWNHHKKGYTEKKEETAMTRFPQDSLSALFYVRQIPLPTGAVITFPVVSEGKSWEAVVTVVRREKMKTPFGEVQTIVLKPELKFSGVLKKQGDSFVWLTDDDRRWVVRIEGKVKIGAVVATLKEVVPGTKP